MFYVHNQNTAALRLTTYQTYHNPQQFAPLKFGNANLSNGPTLQLPVIGDESHFPNAGPLNET